MQRVFSVLLCLAVCLGLLAVPVSADFQVTYYNEEIYAGGILDLLAFVGDDNLTDYEFQWQFLGVGEDSWVDLEDNANYKGTQTNHLQVYTKEGMDYEHWKEIPFRCRVTKDGVSKSTPIIHMSIHPYENMLKAMKNKGMGLYEPNLTNVTDLSSKDDLTYTANTYAGSNIGIICGGSSESQMSMMENSEVQLKREIKITENGKYIVTGEQTNYIPYTVGNHAVKIEINMRIVMAGADKGIYETKTVYLTTKKPNITATGTAKTDCSLLRYTYNESEKLASIPKGTALEVVGREGSYWQVCYNNFVGYVGSSLLEVAAGNAAIDHLELEIMEPCVGKLPSYECNVKTPGCTGIYVDWYDITDGRFMLPTDRYEKDHAYQLTVWAEAADGYRFVLDSGGGMLTTAVINGNLPALTGKAYEQVVGKVIDIRYDFAKPREAEAMSFLDVYPDDYYYDSVAWAVEQGITAGTSATTFSPEETCTRSQVVTFLWRAAGCPKPRSEQNPFTDVEPGLWYHDPVIWAVEQGITVGTSDTTFGPEEECTRGQIVTFLWRAAGCPELQSGSNPFADVTAQDYFYKPALWAVENSITMGTASTTFSPGDPCSQAQVVTFLYRGMR